MVQRWHWEGRWQDGDIGRALSTVKPGAELFKETIEDLGGTFVPKAFKKRINIVLQFPALVAWTTLQRTALLIFATISLSIQYAIFTIPSVTKMLTQIAVCCWKNQRKRSAVPYDELGNVARAELVKDTGAGGEKAHWVGGATRESVKDKSQT